MASLGRRLPAHGEVKGRWLRHQEESRREVFRRCQGRCENTECPQEATDWSHLFGRRALIAEPWASSPACTAGLCRGCHNACDRNLNPTLLSRLRWIAIARLCAETHLPIPSTVDNDELGAIRSLARVLEAQSTA